MAYSMDLRRLVAQSHEECGSSADVATNITVASRGFGG